MRRLIPAILLLGCSQSSPPVESVPEDVFYEASGHGAYDIGRVHHSYVDDRGESMDIEIWYPAHVPESATPTPYGDIGISRASVIGAPPVERDEPWPLIAFSHGFGGIRYQSATLVEQLTSHGFVVVSADHPGSILLDMVREVDTALRRPGDVVSAVDELLDLTKGDGPLGSIAVEERYTVMGHSAGAITSQFLGGGALDLDYAETFCTETDGLSGCEFFEDGVDPDVLAATTVSDPRIDRAVLLSPGVWYAFGEDGVGLSEMVPTLVLTGDNDTVLEYDSEALPVYDALGEERWLGTLHTAGHYAAFSDMCSLLSFFGDCLGPDEGFLDSDTGQSIVNTVVTTWVLRHHLGDLRYDEALSVDTMSALPSFSWVAGAR